MKRGLIAVIIIVILASFISVALYAQSDKPLKDALSFYEAAMSKIDTDNIHYRIMVQKETTIADETYNEESIKTVHAKEFNGELSAYSEEQLLINGEAISVQEWFLNNTLYATLNNSCFSTKMEAEIFRGRSLPFLILEPSLYKTISGLRNEKGYTIYFSTASAPEAWITDTINTFDFLEAEAEFSKDGTLRSLKYSANYQETQRNVKLSVTTQFISAFPDIPALDGSKATANVSPDIAILLEKACCMILASKNTTSVYHENILCEVFGDRQTKDVNITVDNSSSWTSSIKTEVSISNTGKSGAGSKITKEEHFSDDQYTMSINGTIVTPENQVTERDIRRSIRDMLISTVALPDDITSCTITQADHDITYTFTANQFLSAQLKENALSVLYGDPNILSPETDMYQTQESVFYLVLDAVTKLPKASGFRYSGMYTINGLQYQLEYTAHQEYALLN